MKLKHWHILVLFIIIAQIVSAQEYDTFTQKNTLTPSDYHDTFTKMDLQTKESDTWYGFTKNSPLSFMINGPNTLEVHFILDYDKEMFREQDYIIDVYLDGRRLQRLNLSTIPDVNSYYQNQRGIRPSMSRIFQLNVPLGEHTIQFSLLDTPALSARTTIYQISETYIRKEQPLKNIIINFGLSGTYDSNLLRLSESEIDDFIDNYPSERWIDMSTADDVISVPYVKIETFKHFPEEWASQFSLKLSPLLYSLNRSHNSVEISILASQKLGLSNSISIENTFIPQKYYGHVYENPSDGSNSLNTNLFRPSHYLYNHLTLTFQKKLAFWNLGVNYKNKFKSFKAPFENRSQMCHMPGVALGIQLRKTIYLNLHTNYIINSTSNSDDKIDVSYWGAIGGGQFQGKLLANRMDYEVAYSIIFRGFYSEIEDDYQHFSRNDYQHLGHTAVKYQLTDYFSINASYQFIYNDSEIIENENYQYYGDWTSFTRHKISTGFNYQL